MAKKRARSANPAPKAEAPAVLVVDDDPDIRALLVAALADEGYRTWEAANGSDALLIAAEQRLSLILLDMRMPVMNGWEFAHAYAQAARGGAPIVAMTAAADADERGAQIGAQAAIGKPFDLSTLFAVVARHLHTPEAEPVGG